MSDIAKTLRQASVELLRAHGHSNYQIFSNEVLAQKLATSIQVIEVLSVDADSFADLEQES